MPVRYYQHYLDQCGWYWPNWSFTQSYSRICYAHEIGYRNSLLQTVFGLLQTATPKKIKRTRKVDIPRYQVFYSTPNSYRIRAKWKKGIERGPFDTFLGLLRSWYFKVVIKQLSRPKSSRNCRVVKIGNVLGSRFSKTDIKIVFCQNCHLFPKWQK